MPGFINVLKSRLFNEEPCDRLKEAATAPFRSLQTGIDGRGAVDIDGKPDDLSVLLLQTGLEVIESNFANLPRKHLPVQKSTNEPPRSWGRFNISGSENESGVFQGTTFFAVRLFQGQAGLKVDGKAGKKTLGRLDEILVFIDTVPSGITEE